MENKIGEVKVGDFFNDGTLTQITRVDDTRAFYIKGIKEYWVDLSYAWEHRISVTTERVSDNVVNPAHYTTTKISALQVVNDWELDFYLGNALKYMKRYKLKGNPIQDLEKAVQYLNLKIQLLKGGEGKD